MNEAGTKSDRYRIFISLPVPAQVKEELGRLQSELRERISGKGIRWTKPEQIHLTLKFLGDVAGDRVEEVIADARKACLGFGPFQLRSERIGFFPSIRFPRVIWAWVHDDHGHLPRLQKAVDDATSIGGAVGERESFTGHLTIARVQRMKPAEARELGQVALAITERVFGDWTLETVDVMRSELLAGGSRYTRLAEIRLVGPENSRGKG